jgi:hypothetical protein
MADTQTFLANAAQARAEADAAELDNVRERCLRSEAAWIAMAARQQHTDDLRAKRLSEAAAAAAQPEPEEAVDTAV